MSVAMPRLWFVLLLVGHPNFARRLTKSALTKPFEIRENHVEAREHELTAADVVRKFVSHEKLARNERLPDHTYARLISGRQRELASPGLKFAEPSRNFAFFMAKDMMSSVLQTETMRDALLVVGFEPQGGWQKFNNVQRQLPEDERKKVRLAVIVGRNPVYPFWLATTDIIVRELIPQVWGTDNQIFAKNILGALPLLKENWIGHNSDASGTNKWVWANRKDLLHQNSDVQKVIDDVVDVIRESSGDGDREHNLEIFKSCEWLLDASSYGRAALQDPGQSRSEISEETKASMEAENAIKARIFLDFALGCNQEFLGSGKNKGGATEVISFNRELTAAEATLTDAFSSSGILDILD